MKIELNGKDKPHCSLQPFVAVKNKFTPRNEDAVLTQPLFPVPISEQKTSLKKATGLVKILLGGYPQNEKSEHEIYTNINVSTFQKYTFSEGLQVIDNLTSTNKFTPTRAEIIEAFNQLHEKTLPLPVIELTLEEKFNQAWSRIGINLEKQFSHRELSWFFDLKPNLPENGILKIETPRKDWMTKTHYIKMLEICRDIYEIKDVLFIDAPIPPTYLKDFSDEWIEICDILREKLNIINFFSYIADLTPIDLNSSHPKLLCADEERVEYLKKHFKCHLDDAFKQVLKHFKGLDIICEVGNPTS
jgi:hypothetical protein